MKRFIILIALIGSTILSSAQGASNPLKNQLPQWIKGTWQLVSVENIYPDGHKVYPYGEQPRGLLIFDTNGSYALQIYKADRAKVASGDKNKATAEENTALVQGSNAHFGKYTVDEARKILSFNIAYASFPNWNNEIQKREYIYAGHQLKYIVTHTTQGGQSVIAEVTWEKIPW